MQEPDTQEPDLLEYVLSGAKPPAATRAPRKRRTRGKLRPLDHADRKRRELHQLRTGDGTHKPPKRVPYKASEIDRTSLMRKVFERLLKK